MKVMIIGFQVTKWKEYNEFTMNAHLFGCLFFFIFMKFHSCSNAREYLTGWRQKNKTKKKVKDSLSVAGQTDESSFPRLFTQVRMASIDMNKEGCDEPFISSQ